MLKLIITDLTNSLVMLVLFLLFASFIYSISATNFEIGYRDGYRKGYCYQKVGCVCTAIPTPPLPKHPENRNSYKDGYNRGFTDGRAKTK